MSSQNSPNSGSSTVSSRALYGVWGLALLLGLALAFVFASRIEPGSKNPNAEESVVAPSSDIDPASGLKPGGLPKTSLPPDVPDMSGAEIYEWLQRSAEEQEDPLEREIAILEMILSLDVGQLESTLREAIKRGDLLTNNADPKFFPALFERWAGLDPRGLLAFAEEDGALEGTYFEETPALLSFGVLGFWAMNDPYAAIQEYNRSYKGKGSDNWASIFHQALARMPLEEGLQLAVDEGLLNEPNGYMAFFMESASSPEDLLRGLELLADEHERKEPDPLRAAVQGVLYNAAMRDPAAALDLAEQTQNPDVRQMLLQHAMGLVAEKNPRAVRQELDRITDPMTRRGAALSTIFALQVNEPGLAAELLPELREAHPETYQQQVRQISKIWTRKDPEPAGTWASQLPRGEVRDVALSEVIHDLAYNRRNFAPAMRYAERLDSPTQRNFYLKMVGERWMAADPHTAVWAVQNTSLPEPMRQELLNLYVNNPNYHP